MVTEIAKKGLEYLKKNEVIIVENLYCEESQLLKKIKELQAF
ncbi:MAG: hypothetical protein PHD13_02480 [Methanocellales archaeon]|nr:hypothetical protein [Methanocellales archaeon]MDD3291676.1 hypothetical protein [Methanocellales archaeon]MDD5235026.1 hypothetical protein [Methanocellales archaeon]MDD5485164.1 hypothetical protein [Methanocellales archaeon]